MNCESSTEKQAEQTNPCVLTKVWPFVKNKRIIIIYLLEIIKLKYDYKVWSLSPGQFQTKILLTVFYHFNMPSIGK